MITQSVIISLCAASFLINTIYATNNTQFPVTSSIALESSEYYSTISIPIEYNVIYEMYIEYEYTAITAHTTIAALDQSERTNHNYLNMFAISTYNTFGKFDIDIYDTTYCVVFTKYYNESELCSNYQNQKSNINTHHAHIAYGTFVGKKITNSDYNINNIIGLSIFKTYLATHLTKSIGVGSFTIINVDISVISQTEQQTYSNNMLSLLDVIDRSLYILLYIMFLLCIFIMIISKVCGLYQRNDNIQFIYFITFIVFTLNFFANCILLTLRIFEQKHYILAIVCVILFLIRSIFDVFVTIQSKSIWNKSAFINKRINKWYKKNKNEFIFVLLSIISGPIGAISFVNCRLFAFANIFFMNIPESMVRHFIGNMFWKILFIQRIPELIIQIIFVSINETERIWLFSIISTILCLLLSISAKLQLFAMNAQLNLIENNIAKCSFLMEISSNEINKNAYKYLLQPTAFRKVISDVLEINYKYIELLSFEAINVSIENNINKNKKRKKCYGLKIYISVNTISMLRRAMLMKLNKAQKSDVLQNKMMKAWDLNDNPSIDDIVMVFDLNGDLIIQRPINSFKDSISSEPNIPTELIQIIQKELIIKYQRENKYENENEKNKQIQYVF